MIRKNIRTFFAFLTLGSVGFAQQYTPAGRGGLTYAGDGVRGLTESCAHRQQLQCEPLNLGWNNTFNYVGRSRCSPPAYVAPPTYSTLYVRQLPPKIYPTPRIMFAVPDPNYESLGNGIGILTNPYAK